MITERTPPPFSDIPQENVARGLLTVDIPGLGVKKSGKVRESWVVGNYRVMVTTDRLSAFDRVICTVPGKGVALSSLSAFWFNRIGRDPLNQVVDTPFFNTMIVHQAERTLPVEVVVRGYMARSSTTTSLYHHYVNLGERNVYGHKFPDGLKANEQLPMGPVITPTTKATSGHDMPLTLEEARTLADEIGGEDTWDRVCKIALRFFTYASNHLRSHGLILADTKFEFGLDCHGNLMIIDELLTPDSSRFWFEKTYDRHLQEGKDPESFDKEIVRRWLAAQGFTGQGSIPVLPASLIDETSRVYQKILSWITGWNPPPDVWSLPPIEEAERCIQKILDRVQVTDS